MCIRHYIIIINDENIVIGNWELKIQNFIEKIIL